MQQLGRKAGSHVTVLYGLCTVGELHDAKIEEGGGASVADTEERRYEDENADQSCRFLCATRTSACETGCDRTNKHSSSGLQALLTHESTTLMRIIPCINIITSPRVKNILPCCMLRKRDRRCEQWFGDI